MSTATDGETPRAQWIRDALAKRRDEGKTQKGLAEALGLDPSQGHRIAKGDRPLKEPEIPLVERYLGVRAPGFDRENFCAEGGVSLPLLRAGERQPASRSMLFDPELLGPLGDASALIAVETSTGHAIADRAQTDPHCEGLFLLRLDGMPAIRRISINPGTNSLSVAPEDAGGLRYDDIQAAALDIVGRIVWTGRRIA